MGTYAGSKRTKRCMQLVSRGLPEEDGGNRWWEPLHSHQLEGPRQGLLCKVGDTARYENAFNDSK